MDEGAGGDRRYFGPPRHVGAGNYVRRRKLLGCGRRRENERKKEKAERHAKHGAEHAAEKKGDELYPQCSEHLALR